MDTTTSTTATNTTTTTTNPLADHNEHDFFDRQKRIPDWDQELISQQVCFCLGVGGLGCTGIFVIGNPLENGARFGLLLIAIFLMIIIIIAALFHS